MRKPNNDLPPEVNMVSVCYPPGLIRIADKYDVDFASIVAPYLIIAVPSHPEGQEFFDGQAVSEDTSQLLGVATETTDTEALKSPYERIVFALADFDAWDRKTIAPGSLWRWSQRND